MFLIKKTSLDKRCDILIPLHYGSYVDINSPTDCIAQQAARKGLKKRFYAARRQCVKRVIQPNLEAGRHVLLDRFEGSSFAYQGVARGLGIDTIAALSSMVVQEGNCLPDLYIVLDVPPELGLTRKRGSEVNRFELEDLSFHNKVRQGYVDLVTGIQQGRYNLARYAHIIDATEPPEVVQKNVTSCVSALL